MSAVLSIELAKQASTQLQSMRQQRASDLSEIREDLRRIARRGPFSAKELFDLLTCIQSCMPISGDLPEIRGGLVDLACDLDGIVHGLAGSGE